MWVNILSKLFVVVATLFVLSSSLNIFISVAYVYSGPFILVNSWQSSFHSVHEPCFFSLVVILLQLDWVVMAPCDNG